MAYHSRDEGRIEVLAAGEDDVPKDATVGVRVVACRVEVEPGGWAVRGG